MQTLNDTKVREEVKRGENEVKEEAKQINKVMDEPKTPEIWRWANGQPKLMSGPFRNSSEAPSTKTSQLAEPTSEVLSAEFSHLAEMSLTEPLPQESVEPSPLALFARLKQEHNLAKEVKLDDMAVPVDLWDQAVCRGP